MYYLLFKYISFKNDAMNYWVEKGMNSKKLIVGLATFGSGWTLKNKNNNGIGATANRPSNKTPYIDIAGTIAYNEVKVINFKLYLKLCKLLDKGAQRIFDPISKSPYLIYENEWFSYEDVESLTIKVNYCIFY